ncbi:phage tail protein [Neisseria shayeganii]|uniref:Phage tail protein n=1 Tax=Neisseria shayeganii TaxID=607712 RepID=A0A7D7NB37_9NEIS|nr:phage tail protein [Neisseria shayeganii]QMT39998.1 phage tail protein [Neisseria shayeganii]
MATEYVGSITLYVDAAEVDITKLDVKDSTGRKPVKVMSRTLRTKGFCRGVGQYDISITAVVPTDGTVVNWGDIEDAKITSVPDIKGAPAESYLGFCVTEVGKTYTVDNELVVDITGFATRKVVE